MVRSVIDNTVQSTHFDSMCASVFAIVETNLPMKMYGIALFELRD